MEAIKLKISSKRLNSGRFQVNFITRLFSEEYYGYLLAESQTPVREVVEKISRHVEAMQHADRYFQRNLFSLTHRTARTGKILIFKSAHRSDKRFNEPSHDSMDRSAA
jgi:hypothetical protein